VYANDYNYANSPAEGETRNASVGTRRGGSYTDDDAGDYVQKVVDDVQQHLHDLRIDTTWPRCPRHLRHPLWFRDGWWWCECDTVAIARLGELGAGSSLAFDRIVDLPPEKEPPA
jgi:hypothetical protein